MNYFGNIPDTKEKIFMGALYLGIFIPLLAWVPIIVLIVVNIRQISIKDFIRYHCYQALMFNMLVFFLPGLLTVLANFIGTFLSLFLIFDNSIALMNSLTGLLVNAYYILMQIAAVYALIWTLRGKYTYMPPISQAVNMMLR